ncbi:MAG: glycosyl hydrolase [Actinomycetota bacterium]|nr:glycosyl hydrolase [Actinomycetota bacterium]
MYVGSASWQANLAVVEQATGLSYGCLETFETGSNMSWSSWVDPWVAQPANGYTGWVAADPSGRTVVLTVDLVASDESASDASWRGHCAQGQFTGYDVQLAQNLVAAGLGSSVIRLGAEMNGTWADDFVGTTATEQSNWATCFARTVTAMRAVAGASFQFDWNVAACGSVPGLAGFYPGNAYVDIVGVDAYDTGCPMAAPPASTATYAVVASSPEGLDAVASFAASQGKPLSIPEWATTAPTGSPPGYGDDPYYVAGVGQLVASSASFAFQSWYDAGDKGILQLDASNPLSLQAYRAAFG